MLKKYIEDVFFLAGLSCLASGVWIEFGSAWSLMVIGVTMLILAAFVIRAGGVK